MSALIGLFFGSLIGGVITWLVSKHFYLKASKELRLEVQELRRLSKTMLLGMEYSGWIELSRDVSGEITGFRQIIGPSGIPSKEQFGIPKIIIESKKEDK